MRVLTINPITVNAHLTNENGTISWARTIGEGETGKGGLEARSAGSGAKQTRQNAGTLDDGSDEDAITIVAALPR